MTPIQFNEQMNRIANAFGETQYGFERRTMIWSAVQSLELYEFKKVVDHLINSFRTPPLPKDFFEASTAYRKRRVGENDTSAEPSCSHCLDTGFFLVRYHEDQNARTMIRCVCEFGLNYPQLSAIPVWARELDAVFKRSPPPLEWFLPVRRGDGAGPITYASLTGLVEQWKARLKVANEFWKAERARTVKPKELEMAK